MLQPSFGKFEVDIRSSISWVNSEPRATTHPDVIEVNPGNAEDYGRTLYFACRGPLERCQNPDIAEICEHVRNGRYTFLFDEKGEFIRNQLQRAPDTTT